MSPSAAVDAVVERYGRFARDEAPGRSPLYEAWATAVATDADLAAVVARIDPAHRQPPLVFAVMRMLGAPVDSGSGWREWVLAHADAVVAGCAARTVQTNEPLRCAALLPALARIDGPVALLEVGASAGLCLYPDRYSYRYARDDGSVAALDPREGPADVVLRSRWRGPATPPARLPEIVWRGGIDLAPLDPASPDTREWLTALVWPGETGRAERIEAALDVAAGEPPVLVTADAASGAIATLAASVPTGTTLVVSTVGVLPYLSRPDRERVIDQARAAGTWLTLDAPGTHEGWAGDPPAAPDGAFLLAVDGVVQAVADPLGAFVEWLPA